QAMTRSDALSVTAWQPRLSYLIYGLLLLAALLAPLGAVFAGTANSPDFTVADAVTIVISIALAAWWCTVDAQEGGHPPPRRAARLCVLLFMPLGVAIYLLQTRRPGRAALVWLAFELGLVAATALGGFIADSLYPPK